MQSAYLKRGLVFSGVSALAIAVAGPAMADGFKVQEYSVRDVGLANSGNAALASDASTVFSNPAGMTYLDGPQINTGIHAIIGRGEFEDAGSVDALGAPLTGGDGGDAFDDAFVPNFYAVMPLMDGRLWAGLGVSAPFGLTTAYDGEWQGRYQALDSELTVIDINPSIGFRVNDWLSVGAGVSAQYADVRLTNAIDFGAVCLSQVEPQAPGFCASNGILPQQADGRLNLEGDDWSYGFNLGAMIEPWQGGRIGLAYRSEVDHDIEGDAEFNLPPGLSPLFDPAFQDTGASAPLDLPARASVSLRQQVNERLALTGDVTWTQWEDLEGLSVDFENPAQPGQTEVLNYGNTVRFSAGGEYTLNDQWMVRAGAAFDETPTEEAERSGRVPDADRIVLAGGLSWTPREDLTIDAGYQHLFFDDAPIDKVGSSGDRLVGEFDNAADIVSVGLNWRF